MTSKRLLTSLSLVAGATLFAAAAAVAQPTVTSTVVSGNPAAPNATFEVLVSVADSPSTGSVEEFVFKVNYDSRKVQLIAADFVPGGVGGLLPPEIVKPVNNVDPSFSAPDDPSENAFRHVAAADLAGTNTLTDGALVLLTFQTQAWPSAPLGIGLTNPNPLYSDNPADAAAPLLYEVIGSNPLDLREEFAPIFDNSATLNIGAKDTDHDRIPDFAEFFAPGAPATKQTNLNIADSDGDGILDADEFDLGTNPRSRDTDGDGLLDYFEILLGTDPVSVMNAVVDADNDGLPVAVNDDAGNPLSLAPLGGPDPNDASTDTDGDGFLDSYEAIVFTDATAANDAGRKPVLGDVNNSGGIAPVNPTDALICLRLFGGAITLDLAVIINKQAFDVNRDAQINPTDALIMLRRFGGFVPILPIGGK